MKISIITPTYNSEATIRRTIASIASQTHTDLDHIVVDNCSTDATLDIIRRAAEESGVNTTIISEPDTGIYQAINRGIANSSGQVIGILHADDAYASDDVLTQVALRFEKPGCRFVYGDISWRSRRHSDRYRRYFDASVFHPELLRYGIAPPHPSLYVDRTTADLVGPYSENYKIAADFEMFVRLMLVHGIHGTYIPMEMVAMSAGGVSSSFYNILVTNTAEKLRALTENGCPASIPRLACRYIFNLKQYLLHVRHPK